MTTTELIISTKIVKPINFLFFRVETTLAELGNFFMVATELHTEAVKHNLRINGPIHWHYVGFSGAAEKPFILEICLPVSEVLNDYDGQFHFKRTESFNCVSLIHEGVWQEMGNSYGRIMEFVMQNNLIPSGINREVYINVDFANPDANTTEIQLGIL